MKIIAALLLALSFGMAQAKVVTYAFTGKFGTPTRWAVSGDPNHAALFNGLLKEGDQFWGEFSFDNEAAPLEERNPQYAWMLYPSLTFKLTASTAFNTAASTWEAENIQITNDGWLTGETYYDRLIAAGRKDLDSQHVLSAHIDLYADDTAFNDFRVPRGFQDFTSANLDLSLFHYDHVAWDRVYGTTVEIKLLEISSVPEPATILLLLAGLGGLTLLRRRV
ncbi:PEP-CTERM sorting domain-containing protein [Massilia sp. BKSP1R2A-1]|jgi:hypothetical protein|uniref:PEP-CTERM sorting domain-containing protein n=1 Tax=Massilia sp. BKSP1R2A-1 TaxID=3422595 RepID=UPI003D3568E6